MAAQSRGQACGCLCPGHRGGTAAGLSLAGGPLGGCVPQGLARLQPGEGWAASGVEALKLDPRVCTAGEQGRRAWWGRLWNTVQGRRVCWELDWFWSV